MKKFNFFIPILLLGIFVLIGGGCGENVDWPEFCKEEAKVPSEVDRTLIFPESRCVRTDYLETASAWDFSFCAKAQKQDVLNWYKQELSKKGYEYWYDEEYAKDEYLWKKGENYINLGLPYTSSGDFIRFTLIVH